MSLSGLTEQPKFGKSLLLKELLARKQAKSSLLKYIDYMELGFKPALHHRLLCKTLQDCVDGKYQNVMVLMPPGSAKSFYTSIQFVCWYMGRFPRNWVIAASHTMSLAQSFGRRARNQFLMPEHQHVFDVQVSEDSKAQALWHTDMGGQYFAAGVDKAIAGQRADVALIDDPVSGRQAADSETMRRHTWDWYLNDLLPRLKPGGIQILVMTRWNEDDLGGRILARDPGHWHVVSLPMEARENDVLGRKPGERLWPEYFTQDMVDRAKLDMRGWYSLYQQDPRPLEGALFKMAKYRVTDVPPAGSAVRAWDLAATEETGNNNPSWTVGVKLVRTADDSFVVSDVVRLRGGPDEVEAAIVNTANNDGYLVRIGLPQDPGQAGKTQVLYLTKKLFGYTVESSPESGDKVTRAMPIISQFNVGNVTVKRSPWNDAFKDELQVFPNGGHDDQVDALSRASSMLLEDDALSLWRKLGQK
jgi:predicted phage terminase large subunit-like protein